MKKPTKAIIAAAGFGTRFLPQTKAMPKEMMPLIDKPIIQYVVEELVEAGIKDIIIIGSANKRAIEDHFDRPNEELLINLRAGGAKKQPLIDIVNNLSEMANFVYIRQKGPYGNATPLTCAAHLINGDEPVIYTFADDFIAASPSRFRQMIAAAQKLDGAVLSCKKIVDDAEFDRYGVVNGEQVADGVIKMTNIVEKPGKANAPSDLASVSSYLLPGEFFTYLEKAKHAFDGHGEFAVQPIMQSMIDDGHSFYGVEITNGRYYDTGDKLEYLKTVIDFGMRDPKLGASLREYLVKRLEENSAS